MKMRFRYENELQKLHKIYDNIRTIVINVKKILFIGPISKKDQVLSRVDRRSFTSSPPQNRT